MKRNKKAFTIIELIVVIAIIGILMLFGMPKFTGYIKEAKLSRIKHDIKVMEGIMEDEFVRNQSVKFDDFMKNGKDLGLLVEADRLFEKQWRTLCLG